MRSVVGQGGAWVCVPEGRHAGRSQGARTPTHHTRPSCTQVFGTSDLNSGKTLRLSEFLACLHGHQV
jgi:hypothetical protein